MRHFFRTHLTPAEVIDSADAYFATLGLKTLSSTSRGRVFQGVVGTPEVPARLKLSAKPKAGTTRSWKCTPTRWGRAASIAT
jgi:hypothetical protein